ncbi:hypothetical protein AB0L57_00485 [Nocardia sp. NPDC052254]|uniref:hypothetical protein n=1 Tax=Nocardia sp. NPDC052254 TaxID=3155681 RepID=UPI00341AEC4E
MAGIVQWERVRHPRTSLVVAAAAVAAAAFAGAAVLATRQLREYAAVPGPLAWPGVISGAVILVLAVGFPMAVTAAITLAGDRRASAAAVVSGTLLICWVLALMALAQTLTWLQPVLLTVGIVIVALGLHLKTEETGP